MGKLSKDRRDIYYRKAKESGYRARSSFKLIQINEKFGILKLFKPDIYNYNNENDLINIYNEHYCYNIVDLCAAPGSWSQVLKNICLYNYYQILYIINKYTNDENIKNIQHEEFLNKFSLYINYNDELENKINKIKIKCSNIKEPNIVAVDLQEIGNMNYVKIIQGDITKMSTIDKILKCMNNKINSDEENINILNNTDNIKNKNIFSYAHTVVSDGAPDITGMNDIDEFIQSQLILSSLKVCCSVLKIGGNFISKIFRGEHTGLLILHLNKFFKRVYICKPQSSRNKSLESFLVCLNFSLPTSNIISMNNHNSENQINHKYLSEQQIRKYHAQLITNKDKDDQQCEDKKEHYNYDHNIDNNLCHTTRNNNQVIYYDHIQTKEVSSQYEHNNNIVENNLTPNLDILKNINKIINEYDNDKNNLDIFNFYCSDSDEEIKYFNSEDEEVVNNYISSESFMTNKLFTFIATDNYYDSDKSYLLPENYVRHEPQLMPLKPPYMLSLQKKRQEVKK
ncbi:ribosomal RNA methyltransferase, putative [Plasmodium sp. DRC-Itaito]|nr:ribosomal RNA methyltransferase, putative [Plasmodium sp. DRC-Itaito]